MGNEKDKPSSYKQNFLSRQVARQRMNSTPRRNEMFSFPSSPLTTSSPSYSLASTSPPVASDTNIPRSHPRTPFTDASSPSNASTTSSRSRSVDRPCTKQLIEQLTSHRINTLTALCRVERIAASCSDEDDARLFQAPMTAAWVHYVTSNQLLSELRGFTASYPFSADLVHEAYLRVRCDPNSNRSWNVAWLCLVCMRDEDLIHTHAVLEANRPEMWGTVTPTRDAVAQLTIMFENEWHMAVGKMLRHWQIPPTWY